jgi:hypothetical protein
VEEDIATPILLDFFFLIFFYLRKNIAKIETLETHKKYNDN